MDTAIEQYNAAAEANAKMTDEFIRARLDANSAMNLDYEDFVRDMLVEKKFKDILQVNNTGGESDSNVDRLYSDYAVDWWKDAFNNANSSVPKSKEWDMVFGSRAISTNGYSDGGGRTFTANSESTASNFMPLVKSMDDYDSTYFELWAIYAKDYAARRGLPSGTLPESGCYINWYDLDAQLIFMVDPRPPYGSPGASIGIFENWATRIPCIL